MSIRAPELLKEFGYPSQVWKNGPASILKALAEIGVKPCESIPQGRGVAFMVSDEDAAMARRKRIPVPLFGAAAPEKSLSGLQRRQIRSVARALLDLYERLGEEPKDLSALRNIAER